VSLDHSYELKEAGIPSGFVYRRYIRFEVFTAVTMKNAVFWDVTLCRYFVNRRFGGTYRLHLQGIRNPRAMNQHEQVAVYSYGGTPQKTAFFTEDMYVTCLKIVGKVSYKYTTRCP
jgi:hypothetical protein